MRVTGNNDKPVKATRGRPQKAEEDRKKVEIKIWVTPAEREKIKLEAKKEGMRVSPYIKSLISSKGQVVRVRINADELRVLSGLANNMNQVARHLNGGSQITQEALEACIETKNQLIRLFSRLRKDAAKAKERAGQ